MMYDQGCFFFFKQSKAQVKQFGQTIKWSINFGHDSLLVISMQNCILQTQRDLNSLQALKELSAPVAKFLRHNGLFVDFDIGGCQTLVQTKPGANFSLLKFIWYQFSSLITSQGWHYSACQDEKPGLQKLCCRRFESSAEIWLMKPWTWKQNL